MGRRVRVVTDSTADMNEAEAGELGITVVPLNVHWNGDTYQDKVEITIDGFYRKLREEKGTPKTSQPSAGQFEEVYRELLAAGNTILSLHLSGKLSGTVNSAQVAARNLVPDRVRGAGEPFTSFYHRDSAEPEIIVVDTRTTSFSLGLAVQRVSRLAAQGASAEECEALARDLVPRLRLFAGVDTLEFLRRGGRIGRAQAIAANLLAIKLVFEIADGEVVPVDRVRTRLAAVKRTAEAVRDLGPMEELAVLYGDDQEPAEQLRRLLLAVYPEMNILTGRIGPVLGTHTGPGVFGVSGILRGSGASR